MAENTNVNVKVIKRQSMDDSSNFSSNNTSVPVTEDSTLEDSRFKCWCHEILPNQRPCSSACDETSSDKSSKRISISSFSSFDSGYDSRRCSRFLPISENDEYNKQNNL